MIGEIEIVNISADRLKHLDNNPRKRRDKNALQKLQALIHAHGFQGTLNVYAQGDGTYIILCGNLSYDAGIAEGMTSFPCIVYKGDWKQALARAISDKKSNEWTDWDEENLRQLLKMIDEENDIRALEITGFDEKEIQRLFKENIVEAPEVEFSQELLIEHNYIVLIFDNPLDWEVAKEKFQLKTVKDLIERKGQPTGIGRVVKGAEWLPRISD